MNQAQSEIRYLTPPSVEVKKKKYCRFKKNKIKYIDYKAVSYTHLRAHENVLDLVCRLLLEKKKKHRAHK